MQFTDTSYSNLCIDGYGYLKTQVFIIVMIVFVMLLNHLKLRLTLLKI